MIELSATELDRIQGFPERRQMTIFEATMLAEGCHDIAGWDPQDVTEEVMAEAWQLLIDTGTVWQLQGSFGRQAVALIEAGVCSR